jgi:hypothetical protein
MGSQGGYNVSVRPAILCSVVSAILSGHYRPHPINGRAVRPDAYDTANIGTLLYEKRCSRAQGSKVAILKLCGMERRNILSFSDDLFGLILISQMNCRLVDTRIDGRCVDVYAV